MRHGRRRPRTSPRRVLTAPAISITCRDDLRRGLIVSSDGDEIAITRNEWAVRDLTAELLGPAAGYRSTAIGTGTLGSQAIVLDEVAVAFNHHATTARAVSIFPLSYTSGKIPGVDIAKARIPAQFRRMQQILRGCVFRILHFVVFMERRDVPGNIRRHARQEFGQLP